MIDEDALIQSIQETLTAEYETWLDSLGVMSFDELEKLCTRKTN